MAEVRQRRAPKSAAPLAPAWSVEEHSRKASASASSPRIGTLLLVFALFFGAVLSVIGHYHTWLPTPLGMDAPADTFSEARARVVLEKIMSFGYRPVGSEANEVLTPAYLLEEIEKIKANAASGVSIEVDVQKPTGAFGLDFLAQFQNIYANVTNIVVRLASTADARILDNALMISSHYDAAIGGAAASDDGVNVAIMVELLRFFSQRPPTHGALVFNFNGAEETIMQAAHGFITQHKWTKHLRAFINLEAAGAGGRELLFQTGSDELSLAYAEGAAYPHASIIAQELFQTGVIPADTDFRVYRDFGAVAGMDFAYIANGYVYHTKLDDISRIQQGAIQRLGDNLVGVVSRIASVPGRLEKIASTPHSSNTLFFDVAGVAMVSMGKQTAMQLCYGVVLLAVVYLLRSPLTVREKMDGVSLVLKTTGAAIGASLATALAMTLFAPLSWYSNPYLGAATYLPPALAAMTHHLVTYLQRTPQRNRVVVEEALFEGTLVSWLAVLVAMLSRGVISSYLAAMWVLFPLAGRVLSRVLPATMYLAVSLLAVAVPALHSGFVLVLGFMFLLPLMGRCGPVVPPDLPAAVIFAASLVVMLSYSCRFFCLVPVKKLIGLRNVLLVVTACSVVVSSMVNPYTDVTPERLSVQHVHREYRHPNGSVYTQDSGLWVSSLDFRGLAPIKPFLAHTPWKDTSLAAPPAALVEKLDLYGDMPFALPVRDFMPERHSWYLPAQPPIFASDEFRTELTVVSSTYDEPTNRRKIHLHFTGPAALNMFIDASRTRLTSWSIGDGIHGPVPHSDGTYILQFSSGAPPASFHFWIEAESNNSIDVGLVGHHLQKATPEMTAFVNALPSWSHAIQFVSTWSTRTI